MFLPYTKFRIFRAIRKIMRKTAQPFRYIYDFFYTSVISRWKSFRDSRKFILTWMSVIAILMVGVLWQHQSQADSIRVTTSKAGGRYVEAVVGEFSSVNPLFVVDGVNADVSKLIFSSLLEYGQNGELVGDLAESWEANEEADEFTVNLRDDVTWHDGEQFTAEDVVFTVEAMKQEETRSPHIDTWRGVEVEALDEQTVVFKLPNSFAPFPALLRFGVVPQHLLADVSLEGLRAAGYNDDPIGTGPFKFSSFREEGSSLMLNQFEQYHEGAPLINRIELRSYDTQEQAMAALKAGNVDGLGGDVFEIDDEQVDRIQLSQARTSAGTYIFFNTRNDILESKAVRQALSRGFNYGEVAKQIQRPLPMLNGPLSTDQLSLKSSYDQLGFNKKKARQLLQEENWKTGDDGVRRKDGTKLAFTFSIPDTEINRTIADEVVRQWTEIGVEVEVVSVAVEEFQVNTALSYDFDAALITLTNGLDPDVYVYWHSSSSEEGGLNFSGIENDNIDSALEAGRTRVNPTLRKAKYQTFAEEWKDEAPAIGLHQGLFTYVQRPRVRGFNQSVIARPSDRFYNVETWSVLERAVEPEELRSAGIGKEL